MGRGKVRGVAIALLLVAALHFFGTRPALFAIDLYRAHLSPRLRGVIECRFVPTCSAYGRESIRKYGVVVGGVRTAWRIARCGPWTKKGTVDKP